MRMYIFFMGNMVLLSFRFCRDELYLNIPSCGYDRIVQDHTTDLWDVRLSTLRGRRISACDAQVHSIDACTYGWGGSEESKIMGSKFDIDHSERSIDELRVLANDVVVGDIIGRDGIVGRTEM